MIKVQHENGYTGIVYGKKSLSVIKDNKEILHTGSLTKEIKTEKELYEYLEQLPELLKNLDKIFEEVK